MSPYAQKLAIAEVCSFVLCQPDSGKFVWNPNDGEPIEFDPLNDLNAMHQIEVRIPEMQFIEYQNKLCKIAWEKSRIATAAQRAEAFLRTIGRWKDDPTQQP